MGHTDKARISNAHLEDIVEGSELLEDFMYGSHTLTSQRISDLISADVIRVYTAKLGGPAGMWGTEGRRYVMWIDRSRSFADQLDTIVHEGRHILDNIDRYRAYKNQELIHEARAWGAGAEFALRRRHVYSLHGQMVNPNVDPIQEIIRQYKFFEPPKDVVDTAMAEFSSFVGAGR